MRTAHQQLKIEDREKIAIFRAQGQSARAIVVGAGVFEAGLLREGQKVLEIGMMPL